MVDSGDPYRYRKNGLFDQQHFFEETIILPLGDNLPRVDMLVVAVIPGAVAQLSAIHADVTIVTGIT